MSRPTVVNVKKEKADVYIGRGGRWGNPFAMMGDDRTKVIDQFREHLIEEVIRGHITVFDLSTLSGKSLGCFCAPLACHGDVIADAVEWAVDPKAPSSLRDYFEELKSA